MDILRPTDEAPTAVSERQVDAQHGQLAVRRRDKIASSRMPSRLIQFDGPIGHVVDRSEGLRATA